MHTETAPTPVATTGPAPPVPAAPLRLWPPLLFVALYWGAAFVVGRVEKPYFYGFLYGMASAALLALFFFGWWWTRRQVRLRDRLLGFLLVVMGGVVVSPFCHPSVGGFGLVFSGVPVALTAWALWMAVAKWLSLSFNGLGALVVVWLTWSSFTLTRIDGLNADLQPDLRWRWTPSAEDMFRAERAAQEDDASE